MQVYCPKCFNLHSECNMQEFILAPLNDSTGVITTCPDCGSKFLIEITFYSLNPEDEGEAYCG